jgi:hypothetical protein
MGHFSIVYGSIYGRDDSKDSRAVLDALPEQDSWPYLTRDLFSIPAPEHSYGDHLITFGTIYNGVETAWSEWLEKFEDLLQRLDWDKAHVYLEAESLGSYHYCWKRTCSEVLQESGDAMPVYGWEFSGGPRTGLRNSYTPQSE